MRELTHEIKELKKRALVNLHRCVLCVQHDTVLVIIDVGGILEAPLLPADFDRDDPMIFSCRIIHAAGIALALMAKLALRIPGLLCFTGSCNRLRILLRL